MAPARSFAWVDIVRIVSPASAAVLFSMLNTTDNVERVLLGVLVAFNVAGAVVQAFLVGRKSPDRQAAA